MHAFAPQQRVDAPVAKAPAHCSELANALTRHLVGLAALSLVMQHRAR
jgi:hypothetical protein